MAGKYPGSVRHFAALVLVPPLHIAVADMLVGASDFALYAAAAAAAADMSVPFLARAVPEYAVVALVPTVAGHLVQLGNSQQQLLLPALAPRPNQDLPLDAIAP